MDSSGHRVSICGASHNQVAIQGGDATRARRAYGEGFACSHGGVTIEADASRASGKGIGTGDGCGTIECHSPLARSEGPRSCCSHVQVLVACYGGVAVQVHTTRSCLESLTRAIAVIVLLKGTVECRRHGVSHGGTTDDYIAEKGGGASTA